MSLAVTQKVGGTPSFTPPSGAGAVFKPSPDGFSPPTPPTPAQIKASIVKKCSDAVFADVKKLLDDDINTGQAFMKAHNDALPDDSWTTVMFIVEKAKHANIFPLRKEYLKMQHIVKFDALSGAKERCFQEILAVCVAAAKERVTTAHLLCHLEDLIPAPDGISKLGDDVNAVSKSQILRSKVKGAVDKIPGHLLNLF